MGALITNFMLQIIRHYVDLFPTEPDTKTYIKLIPVINRFIISLLAQLFLSLSMSFIFCLSVFWATDQRCESAKKKKKKNCAAVKSRIGFEQG